MMERTSGAQSVKCVVWDLDHTLWDGILLEDAEVRLKPHTIEVVKTLDARGVLQSLASRNFAESAMAKLDEFGLGDYFLAPQIGWIAKSAAIRAICAELNLAPDAIAFLDDDPFERDEVGFALPQVRCWEPADLLYLLDLPEVTYSTITVESSNRRSAYQQDAHRVADAQAAESEIEFLTCCTCGCG